MLTTLLLFITSAILTRFLLGVFVIKLSNWTFHSRPSYRNQKPVGVPLLGGIGIFASILAVSLVTGQLSLLGLLLAASPIICVGVLDDRFDIPAGGRFFGQILSGVGLYAYFKLNHSGIFQYFNHVGFELFVCIFTVVLLANAFNFIDGADGLSGTTFVVLFIPLSVLAGSRYQESAIVVGAVVGFLFCNWYPAKVYLGDVGSAGLGFFVAATALHVPVKITASHTFFALMFLMSYPLIDVLLATVRRLGRGHSPFKADREHIHHRLRNIGFNDFQITMLIFAILLVSVFGGYRMVNTTDTNEFVWLLVTSFGLLISLAFIYGWEKTLIAANGRMLVSLIEYKISSNLTPAVLTAQDCTVVAFDLSVYSKNFNNEDRKMIGDLVSDLSNYFISHAKHGYCGLTAGEQLVLFWPNEADFQRYKKEVEHNFVQIIDFYRLRKTDGFPLGVEISRLNISNLNLVQMYASKEVSERIGLVAAS